MCSSASSRPGPLSNSIAQRFASQDDTSISSTPSPQTTDLSFTAMHSSASLGAKVLLRHPSSFLGTRYQRKHQRSDPTIHPKGIDMATLTQHDCNVIAN